MLAIMCSIVYKMENGTANSAQDDTESADMNIRKIAH